jgi:hypothetical protein
VRLLLEDYLAEVEMKVDYKEVKRIPITSVLAHYKIPFRKRDNKISVANCPFKSHEGASKEHKNWTLTIFTQKNSWYCHADSCREASNKPRGGDVVDMVQMLDNLTSPLDAAKKLSELFCLRGNPHQAPEQSVSSEPTHPPSRENPPLSWQSGLQGIQSEHPYIQARGIHVATAWAFGVGYYECKTNPKAFMHERVVFPLRENGQLIGYAGRTIREVTPENPKWKLPPGLVKSFLFGLERCKTDKPLVIVESPWTVLQLCQDGFQAASLLGHSMSEAQEKCLAPFPTVCVEMDADEPGREANEKIATRLKSTHRVYKALWHG